MRILFITGLILTSLAVFGQRRDKIRYRADNLEVFTENGEKVNKLLDNVVFKQGTTTVYCDSSFYYRKENKMIGYGKVKILDDSTVITSNKLYYLGNDRLSKLREDVVYTRGQRKLYTDSLDYELDTEVARYFNGGKLIDTTNTLTSEIGFFYAKTNQARFYKDVVLISPDFTLKTDTLRYNTITKIAYTDGPTIIEKEDGTQLFSKGGVFRTYIDQSQFIDGNVETEDYYLEGDELFFDDLNKLYKSNGNVILTAKEKDIIIVGDEGFYDREKGLSKIYGSPIMKKILEEDTFFIAADTLVAIESEFDSAKRILAYHGVKIFKNNLQGLCDSISFFLADSLIFMYRDPILWSSANQITGDTIILNVNEETIKSMELIRNAFMISTDTLYNFNQVKGRTMFAEFKDNQLNNIFVNGNGESIFYSLAQGDSILLGMNRVLCGSMVIRFKDNNINNISVYTEPTGKFIPPHELTADIQKLQGFEWLADLKPSKSDIYRKRRPVKKTPDKEPETPVEMLKKSNSALKPEELKEEY
jgi:lipopolysaccharide export system protein LptA